MGQYKLCIESYKAEKLGSNNQQNLHNPGTKLLNWYQNSSLFSPNMMGSKSKIKNIQLNKLNPTSLAFHHTLVSTEILWLTKDRHTNTHQNENKYYF